MRGAELLNLSRLRGETRRLRGALPLLPLALLLAGCAGGGIGGGGGNEGPMGTGNAGNQGLFGSQIQTTTVEADANNAGPQGDVSNYSCPPVEVRGGAAAWQVTESDGGVRYQATLGQFARECRYTTPDMTMRIGIQGRVLLGAKGGPGRVTVPIRVAVVQEGPSPQSVWTKFYSVPVEIGPNVMQVDFGLVADDVSFPRPTHDVLDKYVVYVGFDPQGANEKPAARPRPAAQQQTRPRPATPATSAAPATPRPAAASTPPRTTPAAQTTPVQTAPATSAPAPAAAAPARTVPTTPAPAASAPAAPAPAATAPATTAPAASSGDTQWIGAPAPSTGTFSQ